MAPSEVETTERDAPKEAPAPEADPGRGPIGAALPRKEDRRFTSGEGLFVDDMEPRGAVHLAFVQSPYAHAKILSIECDAARRMPGIVAVLTAADLVGVARGIVSRNAFPDFRAPEMPPLPSDRVHYVGQPVAAVVAVDRYRAEDGVDAVRVEYEELQPVTDIDTALVADAPQLHPAVEGNVYLTWEGCDGDVEFAFTHAAAVVELELTNARCSPLPLEGRAIVADLQGDSGVVWVTSQGPHMLRVGLAAALGMAARDLRVITPDVGGGFGSKLALYAEYVVAAAASRILRAPVKWTADRREEFLTTTQAREQRHRVRAAVTDEGRLLGIDIDIVGDSGAFSIWPQTAILESSDSAESLTGPYDVPAVRKRVTAVSTNKPPTGPYRGVGRVMSCFTMERVMDAIAAELGLDPLDVRERNVVREFPHRTAGGLVLDSGSYLESIELARSILSYDDLRAQLRELRDGGRHLGLGVVVASEPSAFGPHGIGELGVDAMVGYENASISIDADGKVSVVVGSHNHGQSHETTFAQIAAAELEVSVDDVRVTCGDTAQLEYGGGTWASRSTVMAGGAIKSAASALIEKGRRIAAHLLDADPADVELERARFSVAGSATGIGWAEIARTAMYLTETLPDDIEPGLAATRSHAGPEPSTVSNMLHAALVEVDTETGGVEILRYLAIEDCGTIINPSVVDGQVLGGIAQGIGQALHEELVFSETGQPLVTTLLDYGVPTSAEVPKVELVHLESPAPDTAHGAKGVGEGGAIPPPAAVAAAVSDALSGYGPAASVTGLPITPEWIVSVARGPRD